MDGARASGQIVGALSLEKGGMERESMELWTSSGTLLEEGREMEGQGSGRGCDGYVTSICDM